MPQKEVMRPTQLPTRRGAKNTPDRACSNYSTVKPLPPRREFVMPPLDEEPITWRDIAVPVAVVLGGLAILYAITWIYGHFRWGW